ncbi:MAG: hypothetical protein E6R03_12850 [Hyphomicrobiaceae bacterium]|nr:MAG: hypothetical protein E6R03_12850 [Hyphomicrobiaceae bacterium]
MTWCFESDLEELLANANTAGDLEVFHASQKLTDECEKVNEVTKAMAGIEEQHCYSAILVSRT